MSKWILSLYVSCLITSYNFDNPFISWEKGRSMLIDTVVNNHSADSDAGYRGLGNLALLLKKSKMSEWNQRKCFTTKKKALSI